MSLPSDEDIKKMTPMMGQFYELKKRVEDAILLFRMGDFYEIFGDDALEVAPKLDLTLTSREKGHEGKIPFCGVPHHSARSYWLKLLSMGYKVAIAEQVEEAGATKGLVRRDITRVLTPGCIDELEALEGGRANYMMAVWEDPKSRSWWVVVLDVSTGELRAGSLECLDKLAAVVDLFRPREILSRRFLQPKLKDLLSMYASQEMLAFGALPEAILRDQSEQNLLVGSLACGFEGDLKDKSFLPLVAGCLSYLQSLKAPVKQFRKILPLTGQALLEMDETARRDLELFESIRRRQLEGSLIYEIDRTLSPMGSRLLRLNMATPSVDPKLIKKRQDSVEFLVSHESLLGALRSVLKGTPDLQRLITRTISGRATPNELVKIRKCLEVSENLFKKINDSDSCPDSFRDLSKPLMRATDIYQLLQKALLEAPGNLGSLSVFAESYDKELDKLCGLAHGGEDAIRRYENQLRNETGIASLKVKTHKTYGLLLEVTKSNLSKVPSHFVRRQTMVNNERFSTEELLELDETLSQAKEQAVEREQVMFYSLVDSISTRGEDLVAVAEAMGYLDFIQGFAFKAIEGDFCRPSLSHKGDVCLKASRHPVVEAFVGRHDFSPNHVTIEGATRGLFITGPNMAGKSTVMRQTALCAILHQMGSFIPAQSGSLPIFDQIFTRVGAADDLAQGQSTFMVEMSEAAKIMKTATKSSLVIVDEIGRGTSSEDGMAIAQAVLEELCQEIGCYFLFATHFHDLVPRVKDLAGIRFVKTEVLDRGKIDFTHRLVDGVASSSYGIEVATLAGVPSSVIERARVHLETINLPPKGSDITIESRPRKKVEAPASDPREARVLFRLENLKLNKTTPFQALSLLFEFQAQLHEGEQGSLFSEFN